MRRRRCLAVVTGLAFGLLGGACSAAPSDDDATAADVAEIKETKIEVSGTGRLPIAEVSGLGQRKLGGKAQYLAIGDATPTLVTFDLDASGKASTITSHDLSGLFGSGPSQWEAVAGDATGAVFVMNEASDSISVLDPALRRITHTMKLSIPESHPLARDWKKDPNSHGEGMLLLANGHVLVVKEKAPVALVEFAPAGEDAQGYRADLALGSRPFAVPSGASSTLVATKYWSLKATDTKQLPDVSELAVEADGRLLLLTDQGRGIVRVERGLRVDEDKMDLKSVYRLPPSVDKPEGLVMAGSIPMVAIDAREAGETLFSLAPLP